MRRRDAVKELRSFNRFYTNIIGVVDRHILASPYSLTEVRLMFEVHQDSAATARKIKHILRVDEGYLSRTIDGLIRRGLIRRTQSKNDGRTFILALTVKGRREFQRLNRKADEAMAEVVENLPGDRVTELVTILRRAKGLLDSTELPEPRFHRRKGGSRP